MFGYRSLRFGLGRARSIRGHLVAKSGKLSMAMAPRVPKNLVLRRVFEPSDLHPSPVDVEDYLNRKFTVLGASVQFGKDIEWHVDFNGGSWPVRYAMNYNSLFRNDFSDPEYKVHGDIKRTWDFNKHLHFIDLAANYYNTGDKRCLREIEFELTDWIRKNPYLRGIGWSAQLIVAQRAISWILAYSLGAISEQLSELLARSLYLHGVYLSQNLEESSTGLNSNHLIGDLAGLFLIGRSLQQEAWTEIAMQKLLRELDAQVYDDGVHYEQSSGYHRYVEEFLFLVWLANGRSPDKLTQKLSQMSDFLRSIAWPDGSQPFFSDWDGAKVWVKDHHRPKELYALASGEAGRKAFPKGGYYVIQHGDHKLVFDCGPIGMGNKQLATHGHSDLLSFTLAVFGEPILVDPGSGSYTEHKDVHDYCRSTRGHNALVVDGRDQCGLAQTWAFHKHPSARVLEWSSSDLVDVVEGEHDGYAPIIHKRRIEFLKARPTILVRDQLEGSDHHRIERYFHFGPHVKVSLGGRTLIAQGKNAIVTVSSPDTASPKIEEGYYAYDYGVVTSAPVGCLVQEAMLPATIDTKIEAVPSHQAQS